jgi:hypothetical protein
MFAFSTEGVVYESKTASMAEAIADELAEAPGGVTPILAQRPVMH